jgi:hypothetical protein
MSTDESLTGSNYREIAQKCIAVYQKKGLALDCLLWSQIIGYYEAALQEAKPAAPKKRRFRA